MVLLLYGMAGSNFLEDIALGSFSEDGGCG